MTTRRPSEVGAARGNNGTESSNSGQNPPHVKRTLMKLNRVQVVIFAYEAGVNPPRGALGRAAVNRARP